MLDTKSLEMRAPSRFATVPPVKTLSGDRLPARWVSTLRWNGVNAIARSRGLAECFFDAGCDGPSPAATVCAQPADHQSGVLDRIGQDGGVPEAADAELRTRLLGCCDEFRERVTDAARTRGNRPARDDAPVTDIVVISVRDLDPGHAETYESDWPSTVDIVESGASRPRGLHDIHRMTRPVVDPRTDTYPASANPAFAR
ncbi:hypothetical protein MKK75_15515 [Methylobacterium sp. J-030]|uniref:hypothetical protein n=1 Tax=Methylobacterium sp. J-030 TaxID=2836627 RepID=UPI001FBB5E94|nr:hypothetical protein [Methylobacterium sp. J-030]MCJ2070189.1 hypothetical protein [Methylobacterium sp. J-030]